MTNESANIKCMKTDYVFRMRISTAGKDIFPTLLWQYKLTEYFQKVIYNMKKP